MQLQSRFVILLGVSFFIMFAILLSSCAAFEDPSKRATENAEITALWSQVNEINTNAPVMQEMMLTADGADAIAAQLAQAELDLAAARSTNIALQNNSSGVVVGTLPASNGFSGTTVGGGSPAGAGPSAIPSVQFIQTTTTSGTNDDGCAIDTQNVYTLNDPILYFVATALNLPADTNFTLRITNAGQIVMTDEDFWISDTQYDSICVWYGIDQDTITFNPGTYTIQLLANNVVGAEATFIISAPTDTTGAEDQMDDS
jgi:hypothetical protein